MDIQHPHWKKVLKIVKSLAEKDFKAWLAGGCVRDALIGRTPKDFDIVTDAKPDEIENLFEKTIAVGKAFGIIKVQIEDVIVDVATFRSDFCYKDGRHPESIKFSTPKEDALRRDFTINALFYDPLTSQIYDFVKGREDIEQKIIRTIGNPKDRFDEDKLRLLRALRFVSELGFQLEEKTFSVLKANIADVKSVSSERIREELLKLLKGQHLFKSLDLLRKSGALEVLFHENQMDDQNWKVFKEWVSQHQPFTDPLLCLAALLLTLKIEDCKPHFFSFHSFSKKEESLVSEALEHQREISQWNTLSKARRCRLLAKDSMPFSLRLYSFFILLNPIYVSLPIEDLIASCKPLPQSYLRGEDLIERGISGKSIGEWLDRGMEAQLEGVVSSRKEALEWLDQGLKSSKKIRTKR